MTSSDNRTEIRRLRRMLREIADLSQSASMTGSLAGGAPSAIRRYNAVISHLEQAGTVAQGFFQPLSETASFDELGVESALLAGYLKEIEDELPQPAEGPSNNVIIGSLLLKDLQELKDLGKMIREHFPAWMKSTRVDVQVGKSSAGSVEGETELNTLAEVESRLADVSARLQNTAEQLRRDDLSDDQRVTLAEQLAQLSQEQARLARRRSLLRR